MQYMEKVIENERTGANISGIRVETQTSALLNRPDLQGLAELERIAKEADQVNLKNKQQKFMLDLEAMDLEFEEKWNDPLIYNDQEKYETMLSEKKALESEKAALVQQNQFFSLGEKDILRQQLSNRHAEFVLKHQKERNAVVLRQAIDDSQANLDQYVTLSSKVNIHDYNRINEYNEQIVENIKSLQTLTGMSDEEVINTAASRIQQATNARYQTYLNDMILNKELSSQERKRRVNELEAEMNNEGYKRSVAKELSSKLPTDDKKEAEDFFYASLNTETKSIVNGMKRQFNEIKREENRIAAAERRAAQAEARAREQAYAEEYNKAYNSMNYDQMEYAITKKTSKGVRFDDRIAGEIQALQTGDFHKSRIYHITGKTLKEINDRGEFVKGFVPPEVQNNMYADIDNYMQEGYSEAKATVRVASEYAKGNADLTHAIVNSISQQGGYNKTIEISLKALKGDPKAQKQEIYATSIEKSRRITHNLKTDAQLLNDSLDTTTSKKMVQKLQEKGIDGYQARQAVAELKIGLEAKIYQIKTKQPTLDKDLLYLDEIKKTHKKEADKRLSGYANDDLFMETMADTIKPIKKKKSTKLEGDLKL